MPFADSPAWTLLPFPVLVVAVALLPVVVPRAWARRSVQLLVVAACAAPVIGQALASGRLGVLARDTEAYASFATTLAALYVTAGGVEISGDLAPRPSTNVALVLAGAMLASVVGTTGASLLLIRPLLRANRRRVHRAHLVPFFIVAVANAGGLLTPLGDPPLLVGYVMGVPFLWTLALLPAWVLYVGLCLGALYVVDARAHAREPPAAVAFDREAASPLVVRGKRNAALLLAVVPAALLPSGHREVAMVAITAASLALTPATMRAANGFSTEPIVHVAIVFAGVFACLGPVEAWLARSAPSLPVRSAWQLFWASGLLSAVLDNAPTYTAFVALARGASAPGAHLVAGIAAVKLAAVSIGTVVMGATTYVGNGPNLLVKAIADRERFPTPGFLRHAGIAFAVMAPAHLVTTVVLAALDR